MWTLGQEEPIRDYFSAKEKKGLSLKLIDKLNRARYLAKTPFCISSGRRTDKKNKKVGGVRNSAHLSGLAVDIKSKTSHQRFKIAKSAIAVGFNRIGIGKTFVHLDIDLTKPQEVIWLYD
jgi:uncharacterized protein YcbK (DUF882 family)